MFSTTHFQFVHRVHWLQGQFLVFQDVVEDIIVTQYYPAVYITNEAHPAGAYAEQRNNMVQITELAQDDVRHDTFNQQQCRVENYWNSRMKNYAHIHAHRRKQRVKPYDIKNRGAQRLNKNYDDEFFTTYENKNKNFYFKTEQPNESKDSAPTMPIFLTCDNEQVDSDESNHGTRVESGDKCEQQKESRNTNEIQMKECMRGINEKENNYFVCHSDQNNEFKVTAQKQSIHFKCDYEEQDAHKIRLSQTEETKQKAEKQETTNTNDMKMRECISGINDMGQYLLHLIDDEEENDDKECNQGRLHSELNSSRQQLQSNLTLNDQNETLIQHFLEDGENATNSNHKKIQAVSRNDGNTCYDTINTTGFSVNHNKLSKDDTVANYASTDKENDHFEKDEEGLKYESTSNITLTDYNADNEKQNTTEKFYGQIAKTEEMNRKQQTSLNQNVNHTKESIATDLGIVNLSEAHGTNDCSVDGDPDLELGGSQKEGDHDRRRWWTSAARHVRRRFGLSRRRDAPADASTRRASWRRLLCCFLGGGCDE